MEDYHGSKEEENLAAEKIGKGAAK